MAWANFSETGQNFLICKTKSEPPGKYSKILQKLLLFI